MEVDGERHRAAAVILNVGARPIEPPIPGLAGVTWLDNRRVMELEKLPSHLIVIGGGYIGCEFAQAFRRFGSSVTIGSEMRSRRNVRTASRRWHQPRRYQSASTDSTRSGST